jgi:hypothetical protein
MAQIFSMQHEVLLTNAVMDFAQLFKEKVKLPPITHG